MFAYEACGAGRPLAGRRAQGQTPRCDRVIACNDRSDGRSASCAREGLIGRGGKTTSAKRDREKALQNIRKEKDAKRALRKAEKDARPVSSDGEDPDLAGLRWGPQAPLY